MSALTGQIPDGMLMSGVLDVDMSDLNIPLGDQDHKSYGGMVSQPNQVPPEQQGPGSSNVPSSQPQQLVIGAGPLPTGFGAQIPAGTGSTLTEFTKRRNWSKLVIEELRDLMLILSPDSRVQWASPSCKILTGHEPNTLLTKFLTDFIHHEDRAMFLREFNESIASGQQMRFFYRFLKEDGTNAIFEAHGHPHLASEAQYQTGGRSCRGVFMMSRPYPTKTAALLDSFLEHKIDNERLSRRIADLKREEQTENDQQEHQWKTPGQNSYSAGTESRADGRSSERASQAASNYNGMPPPAKPSISNIALTRQNLDEVLASQRPDSINDKMARYEAASHIETIEMLTGLRYRDGERSEGISTGATSPALIRGDIGIPVVADRDSRAYHEKKKKIKVADEYVCTDCGTLDSPEWRKGPSGPKTLCNACGRKSRS